MNINNSILTGGAYYMAETIIVNNRALKILTDAASPSAFHNSGSRHDPPKCHENTRVAVLEKLKDWVSGSDPDTREKWIMWMYGGAGAGKSAIGQTFAEKCDNEGRLLASFFFGRSDPTRNQATFLIPTIACQVYERVPEARNKILTAIDNDPMIFNKTVLIQLESLVIEPLMQLEGIVTRNVIIIDGLDECLETTSQTAILRALFDVVQRPNSRICLLVASRPEHDIVTTFSLQDSAIFARLILDDEYKPDEDIKLFLNDKIRVIKETHPFRRLIPKEWPTKAAIWEIVKKSSGQFIYVSTSVKYIESIRHRPEERMAIVRNLRPAQGAMPFAELDALYTHILTSAQGVSIIVEVLSFVLHLSQISLLMTLAWLEEIHDLEPESLQVILCDLGSLVVIDEYDRIEVLHASLLDFLIDPLRSKDLPISGNALMTKHITTCFRFLSKNKISDGTRLIIDSTMITVLFLEFYLDRIPVFTADMAEAFDGFSLLKLCQQDKLDISTKHNFLKWVNPVLLRLLRQSDQHQFLSRYLTMMDECFLALMDQYPPHALALQISVMMHDDVFPDFALDLSFQLPAFREEDEKLGILCLTDNSEDLGPTKAHRSILCEFLVDPTRSRHHHFLSTEPKLYAMALLGCLDYLSKVVIRQDCSIDETWLDQHASSVVSSEEITLDNQGAHATPENYCAEITPGSSEEYTIIDTAQDIQTWKQGWPDDFETDESLKFACRFTDLVDLKYYRGGSDMYRKVLRGRYYLMLGYMIYFFPLAGFSQELIELCKTTALHRDPRLFPEQTASAQRAMAAYLRRMVETMGGSQNDAHKTTHTILLYPSVSYNAPVGDGVHISTGNPNNQTEELERIIPTVDKIAADSANLPPTHTAVAHVPVASSMSRISPSHLGVDPDILVSAAASQADTSPAEIANDAGTKVKTSKRNIFSRLWHALKRS